jgi:hypothetical protein
MFANSCENSSSGLLEEGPGFRPTEHRPPQFFATDWLLPLDKWPNWEHEQAIFEESFFYDRPWGSWPEVDHEKVRYELMCNYVCIHPDTARERKLALVVKTSDPPSIGFVHGMISGELKVIEQYQRTNGVPAPPLRTRRT